MITILFCSAIYLKCFDQVKINNMVNWANNNEVWINTHYYSEFKRSGYTKTYVYRRGSKECKPFEVDGKSFEICYGKMTDWKKYSIENDGSWINIKE